jgi:hypothetical protein
MAPRPSDAPKLARGSSGVGVHVRMPDDVVAALERALDGAKATRSDLIRRIVVEWLAVHGHLPGPGAAKTPARPVSRVRGPAK